MWCMVCRGRQVALDIAQGLAFMHSRHMFHLDLKSSNILLTADGTAKIGDMGLSTFVSKTYMSQPAMLGTFAWVSHAHAH